MSTQPTPTELKAMWQQHAADIGGIFDFARAVLAKWGQPAQAAEPVARTFASHAAGEAGYCLFSRPVPSETPLYAAPQPVEREPLTDEQIQDLLLCGNPTDEEMRLIRIGWEAANGIKGGQHG